MAAPNSAHPPRHPAHGGRALPGDLSPEIGDLSTEIGGVRDEIAALRLTMLRVGGGMMVTMLGVPVAVLARGA